MTQSDEEWFKQVDEWETFGHPDAVLPINQFPSWYDQDNAPNSPLEADWSDTND